MAPWRPALEKTFPTLVGHGKLVEIWAMGVITYILLCGYTRFDRDTQPEEMEASIARDYKLEPKEFRANVSDVSGRPPHRRWSTRCPRYSGAE
ncbi:hypothetical protein AURDEDRAFT_173502 [Auricularia subglabra TFB-10046 SS5]|nr:hypothetical protein AURDEDRAFT_173502 [Auricularia subglabra TFB-10046 SS5]